MMYKVSLQLFTELFGNFPNMGEGGLLNPKTLFPLPNTIGTTKKW